VRSQQGERLVGPLAGDEREELPFVGDVERVEPEDLARSAHFLGDGDRRLGDRDADAGGLRDLVEDRGDAAPRRVAQDVDVEAEGFEKGRDHAVQGGGVGRDRRSELEPLAQRHDRDAVLGDRAGDEEDVAGFRPPG